MFLQIIFITKQKELMKNTLLFLILIFAFSCKNDSASVAKAAPSADLAGFTIVDFPNSKMQKAIRVDASGNTVEEGELLDGKKTGTWVEYHNSKNLVVKTITNYVDGMKNGIWMQVGKNNRVEAYGYFANDQKDGIWLTYNFSRREVEEHYKNGKLHGFRRTFYSTGKDGVVKEEVEFKNGVQDGVYRYYLEDGTISIEYVYKDGKIVERIKQG